MEFGCDAPLGRRMSDVLRVARHAFRSLLRGRDPFHHWRPDRCGLTLRKDFSKISLNTCTRRGSLFAELRCKALRVRAQKGVNRGR